jgi:hypothetical protein
MKCINRSMSVFICESVMLTLKRRWTRKATSSRRLVSPSFSKRYYENLRYSFNGGSDHRKTSSSHINTQFSEVSEELLPAAFRLFGSYRLRASTLKLEAVWFSETTLNFYRATWRITSQKTTNSLRSLIVRFWFHDGKYKTCYIIVTLFCFVYVGSIRPKIVLKETWNRNQKSHTIRRT